MNYAFEVIDLTFSYQEKELLSKINLQHFETDINLWLGSSGIGKSTLAKLICSHLTAQKGQIKVFDQVKLIASKDRLYIPHENDLFVWQNFEQHIVFLQKELIQDISLSKEEIAQLASLLQIDHLFKKHPSEISMGEIRRFQVLRSFILKSSIVFFDETFSAIDPDLKKKLMPQLFAFWKKNKTSVVIISHEAVQNFDFQFNHILDFNKLRLRH